MDRSRSVSQVFYLDGSPSREVVDDAPEPTKRERLEAALAIVESIETLGSCEGDNAIYDAEAAIRRALSRCKS